MRTKIVTMLFVLLTAGVLWAEEKVVVGGSGGLIDEMQDMAKAYMAKHPGDKVEVLDESMSTSGGIGAVMAGRFTIGLVTRAPKGEEKAKLVYRAVGRSPVGVAVNKNLPVNNLTEAQICGIFGGKIKSWKEVGGEDVKIMLVTRKQEDNNTEVMREKIACFKELKLSSEAIALSKGTEVLDAVNKRPSATAIVSVATSMFERPDVKAVTIEGIPPSADAVKSGKYRAYNERGVVTLGQPQGAAKKFLDFVASAEGQKVLAKRAMIPVM
ncbi:MAG TPA: substrate-binding domain-containing protein [Candidatus Binatia bacterium]|jgi:phosphate transport system substrate-binding protein